ARDDSGLWTAKQFVSAENDQRNSRFDTFPNGRLLNPKRGQIQHASGTDIFHQRKISFLTEGSEFAKFRFIGEATHLEVRRVHAHQKASLLVDGAFIVFHFRAVGRTDLAQNRTAFRHDFGNAKAVPDFDEFAA